MPAGSDGVELPHTFRPYGVRLAVYAFGGALLVVCVVMWIAFPADVRAKVTFGQGFTFILLGAGLAVCGYALARCRVVAREGTVTIVNGYKTRTYEWTQIIAVSLRPGSPWVTLDLSDGSSISAMGIQGSDGGRAVRQVKALRALVDAQSRTDRND